MSSVSVAGGADLSRRSYCLALPRNCSMRISAQRRFSDSLFAWTICWTTSLNAAGMAFIASSST